MVDRLRDVPAFLTAAQATLVSPPDIFTETARAMLGGGGSLIAAAVERLGAQAPELAGELEGAGREALVALRSFGTALRDGIATDTDPTAFAVGEEQFERRLRYEHALQAGAPELWRYGLRLRDEVEAELSALAREIDPRHSWRELVQRLREEGAPPEAQLLSTYRDEVRRAEQFLADRQVVSLTDVPLEVVATPPYLRPMLPFAAYDMPPILLLRD
jgi:hypothetical protein